MESIISTGLSWNRSSMCYCGCARAARHKILAQEEYFGRWYEGDTADVAVAKQGNMHTDGFKYILNEFAPAFDCIKPLCRKVRGVLFPLTKDGELDLTTKPDHRELYGPFINACGMQ